ncbi:MAG: translation elongation factor 4 [Candidatus Pacebacteria bacterium]|nr:translation elongation factor 4 [Candidatus Paceibacterota bacterium]
MNNIRNFVIISHIDHGKSTLADRFLEITHSVSKEKLRDQYLDSMDLEREKGITIKMHPVRLLWQYHQEYILNLIDTPGHVDFSYEISRALACVEGAVLLVDAVKGIQAQTLFNLEQAQKQNLKIIGVINKIDLPQANVAETKRELAEVLNVAETDLLAISGREGTNVGLLLERIINQVPPPQLKTSAQGFQALVFDSQYDAFSGVIAYVRVFSGKIRKGDSAFLIATKANLQVKEVGYFLPHLKECDELRAGEIGYIKTGLKEPLLVRVGDTVICPKVENLSGLSLPGYQEPKQVLFLSLFPRDAGAFPNLKDALLKLQLNDPALKFESESKMALGRGFRVGFLGALHAEIVLKRLQKEFDLNLVATSPQVVFKILQSNGKEVIISSPSLWPEATQIQKIEEPYARLEIVVPNIYFSQVVKILQGFHVNLLSSKALTAQKSLLEAEAPLREIITGSFYDKLKSGTEGYASFNFETIGFREAGLVKLDILVAGRKEDAFSRIVSQDEAYSEGKVFLQKLKDVLPAQQFAVALQASVGGNIIARETIRALRKDVTAHLYGGDITRRKKLWAKQRRGKEELKQKGRINIPADVFLQILKD